MEKVDNDLANVSYITGQLKEIDICTSLLLKDQERELKRIRQINKNIKLFQVIMNRLDPESPG
jgi:small nuclear ribonucleoprotein (snRNP)-like protein